MSPDRIDFEAPEYHSDGSFRMARHAFARDDSSAWNLYREGIVSEQLGRGYVPVRPVYCGVCATDLARRYLPFPLPQIIGHEVLALHGDRPVVVEINASHAARGLDLSDCPFCREHLYTHCPERLTLGINRLPGGFSPYMLAPVSGIVPVPGSVSDLVAVFAEPFAAALHAVERTPPADDDEVAVLGPRRLGLLLIAALAWFRKKTGRRFRVTALLRHPWLEGLCADVGADRTLDVSKGRTPDLKGAFHTVFDTSGTPEGFELALHMSSRKVHLKSTHGRPAGGLTRLTDMVVEEIGMTGYEARRLMDGLRSPMSSADGPASVFLAPSVSRSVDRELEDVSRVRRVRRENAPSGPGLPVEVVAAVVSDLSEADALLDRSASGPVRLRPRGQILFAGTGHPDDPGTLQAGLLRGLEIHTSRCGSLQRAIRVLQDDPELGHILEKRLITHVFPLRDIAEAFRVASDSRTSIKVVVDARG